MTSYENESLYQLVGEWITLVNEYGRHSSQVNLFYSKHKSNTEFVKLVETADKLKTTLGD